MPFADNKTELLRRESKGALQEFEPRDDFVGYHMQ
jgi:hypothetical protein